MADAPKTLQQESSLQTTSVLKYRESKTMPQQDPCFPLRFALPPVTVLGDCACRFRLACLLISLHIASCSAVLPELNLCVTRLYLLNQALDRRNFSEMSLHAQGVPPLPLFMQPVDSKARQLALKCPILVARRRAGEAAAEKQPQRPRDSEMLL